MIGPLFHKIISDQFKNIRDGDKYWYENRLTYRQINFINNTTLSDIIKRNTDIKCIHRCAFILEEYCNCKKFEK